MLFRRINDFQKAISQKKGQHPFTQHLPPFKAIKLFFLGRFRIKKLQKFLQLIVCCSNSWDFRHGALIHHDLMHITTHVTKFLQTGFHLISFLCRGSHLFIQSWFYILHRSKPTSAVASVCVPLHSRSSKTLAFALLSKCLAENLCKKTSLSTLGKNKRTIHADGDLQSLGADAL